MKKIYFAVITSLLMLMAVGCNKSDDASNSSEETEPAVKITETQPDPLDPTKGDDAADSAEATEEPETTAAATEEQTTAEPVSETSTSETELPAETDESGAVNLKIDDSTSDEELIAAGQELFKSACDVNWKFHVGCPYTLDYESVAENSMGWQFYLITDEGINSLADVEADYHKVFSDAYPNDLSEIFMEHDGRLYALDGGRGGNVYYIDSVITEVQQRLDNEIIFNVENRYSGDDYTGEGEYTENAEFSAVIDENGTWRAGLFTLPY